MPKNNLAMFNDVIEEENPHHMFYYWSLYQYILYITYIHNIQNIYTDIYVYM